MTDKPVLYTELDSLKNSFKAAWQFMKAKSLHKLPQYLVIGNIHAGKTLFITQSQLKFIPAPELAINPKDEIDHHKRCNWWFSEEATFIDVPGEYLSPPKGVLSEYIHWQQFLPVLEQHNRHKPLTGVILVLNVAECATTSKTEQQTLIQHYKNTLYLLIKQLKNPCPIYLLLSHVDRIEGFNEFFADLGEEEHLQPLGFSFANPDALNLTTLFKTKFDKLLKKFYDRVIWRLHQERNSQKRILIQRFPLQLENLKTLLANFIYQLSDIIKANGFLPIQGTYFISNLQFGNSINYIHKSHASTHNHLQAPFNHGTHQTFFAKRLLGKIIAESPKIQLSNPHYQQKTMRQIYWVAAGIVLGVSSLMAYAYNGQINDLKKVKVALAQYNLITQQIPPNHRQLNQTLPALNILQRAIKSIEKAHLPWLMSQGLHQQSVESLAKDTYQSALNIYFLPGLTASLEQILTSSQDPNTLYGALKIYLMLGDANYRDPAFMKNWLQNYWQQNFSRDPVLQKQLNVHLAALLDHPILPPTLNHAVINKTRSFLHNIPASQLAYLILKNQTVHTLYNPFLEDAPHKKALLRVFPNIKENPGIPTIYTAKEFQKIYFNQINQVCLEAIKGNWVIGAKTGPTVVESNLIKKTQQLYLKDYASHWKVLLVTLQMPTWQSWEQAHETLRSLLSRKSPFANLLKIVKNNTEFSYLFPAEIDIAPEDKQLIQENLTNEFSSLNQLLPNNDSKNLAALNKILLNIQNLDHYLESIADTKDSNKAAYNVAKARFSSDKEDPINALLLQAKNLPLPAQLWIKGLAQNSWRLILNHAETHLNTLWQKQVFSYYETHINNRYPLLKNASEDIMLGDFAHFFAVDGVLNNYVKNYLSVFIDSTTPQLQWRKLDGESLGLSTELLTQFERATIIRNMFFDDKNALSTNFALQPIGLGPEVTSVTLTIYGQTVTDQRKNKTIHNFNWPVLDKQQNVILTFNNTQGQPVSSSFTGPWAIFKLLDKAQSQPMYSTKRFELTFDLNGYAARYLLIIPSEINPFIPGVLDNFRCPEKLTKNLV